MINRREIATAVILSIVTCGIYMFYWIAMLNDESKRITDDTTSMAGGMVVLLGIVTCGIYMIYWMYIMGKRMQTALQNTGLPAEDRSVVYIILSICSLSIVSLCLIQNDMNQIVSKN